MQHLQGASVDALAPEDYMFNLTWDSLPFWAKLGLVLLTIAAELIALGLGTRVL